MYEQHAEMLAWDSAMAWAGVMEYAGAGAATHAEGVATSCPARAMLVSRLSARLHPFSVSFNAPSLHHKPALVAKGKRACSKDGPAAAEAAASAFAAAPSGA